MQQRALATRERLLRAAAEIFAANGYAGTSLTEIHERAGVTKGDLLPLPQQGVGGRGDRRAPARTLAALVRRFCTEESDPIVIVVALTFAITKAFRDEPVMRAGARLPSTATWARGDRVHRGLRDGRAGRRARRGSPPRRPRASSSARSSASSRSATPWAAPTPRSGCARCGASCSSASRPNPRPGPPCAAPKPSPSPDGQDLLSPLRVRPESAL